MDLNSSVEYMVMAKLSLSTILVGYTLLIG